MLKRPLAWIWLSLLAACPASAADRPAAVAGGFYPSDAKILGQAVDEYLARAPAPGKLPGPLVALVLPHAGYEFSAPVAAAGYRAVSGRYDTVVIMGTAHYAPVAGAALYAHGGFLTPLGRIPVDETIAGRLIQDDPADFQDQPDAFLKEHSIEVQLPFLIKRLKPGWKLLPVIMNTEDPETRLRVGRAVAAALKGRRVLLIASSDLSHYPPAAVAERVDRSTLKALETLDPKVFWLSNRLMLAHNQPGEEVTWCGEAAVMAVLEAANALGADRSVLLRYANSGSVPSGEPGRTVGYAAVALVRSGQPPPAGIQLSPAQKQSLLALARQTVAEGTSGRRPEARLADDPALNLPAAVFVTLTEGGQLRGCVGTTEPQATLRDAVAGSAYSAGFEDQRFAPVAKEELAKLHFEISILSSPRPVAGAQAITPQKHGVIVSQGGRMGLFLPQVWEQIPEKAGFLSELCAQKAGLPRDCWKDPKTTLAVFTVSAFQ